MGAKTGIAWTDHTFNPWIGCQKVSPGCNNCYAENDAARRFHLVQWGPHGERKRTSAANWKQPFRWARKANGRRPRVFCASWADVFDNRAPHAWRADLFDLIGATPELNWQLLTKRPENIRRFLPANWNNGYSNVWLGVTAEDQEHFDRRWPILARIPAIMHFISYEPALGPLRLDHENPPGWIICGGESGPRPRMMDPQWARDLRDQCSRLAVPFFMKQMTRRAPIPADLMVQEFPAARVVLDRIAE